MYWYLSLGAAVAPEENLGRTLGALAEAFGPVAVWPATYTESVGLRVPVRCVNALAVVWRADEAARVKASLRDIERALGRDHTRPRDAPVPCDIDILGAADSWTLAPFHDSPAPYVAAVLAPDSPRAPVQVLGQALPAEPCSILPRGTQTEIATGTLPFQEATAGGDDSRLR